jgi:coenzyme F420-reducing hydrogenase gamma subunit
MPRPRIAVYKFSSCAGCQLQILNIEDHLLDIAGAVDLAYFVMARREKGAGPFDIGFVEGAITSPEEVAKIKQVRKECKTLVALGTCAAFGGIPTLKNWQPQREMEERVYTDLSAIHSVRAYPIDQYVKVDAILRGCPIDRDEFLELVKSALVGSKPYLRAHSICNECKLAENVCLFQTEHQLCMGPVTAAGCGAFCPSVGRTCQGCRGPATDANVAALAQTMMDYGAGPDEIRRKFRLFAGESEAFQKGVAML